MKSGVEPEQLFREASALYKEERDNLPDELQFQYLIALNQMKELVSKHQYGAEYHGNMLIREAAATILALFSPTVLYSIRISESASSELLLPYLLIFIFATVIFSAPLIQLLNEHTKSVSRPTRMQEVMSEARAYLAADNLAAEDVDEETDKIIEKLEQFVRDTDAETASSQTS